MSTEIELNCLEDLLMTIYSSCQKKLNYYGNVTFCWVQKILLDTLHLRSYLSIVTVVSSEDWPVLEPDLDDPHVQSCVLAQLFPYVPRGLRTVVVRHLQGLQLLGGDGGARPLVRLVTVQASPVWNRRPLLSCVLLVCAKTPKRIWVRRNKM